MPQKILVTGGTGFIGRHLCARLVDDGWDATAVTIEDVTIPDIRIVKANILDEKSIAPLIEQADVVVHLAAITEHDAIFNKPFQTLELNYSGTRNVLNAFVKGKAQHFIYPSTGKVYGKPVYLPYDEEHPTRPSTILGKSKLIAEKLIDFYSAFAAKSFSIFRIFNVYGPEQKGSFLIPTILRQISNPIINLGDLKPMRDYIYIDDLIEAFMTVIKNPGRGLNIYNAGSGKSYSALQILETLDMLNGTRHEIASDPSKHRKDEYDDEKADTKKLSRLGWHTITDIESGLKKTLDAWKRQ